ncbi:MAG: acetyl-CoA carboxylase biotin carboxyl carrier protein subunit [Bacteroidales bacterium]|nr:acetyl-CoA carboxylase biotin carboxyl carrier protein subunit [Bacteroidales bacterium]
MNNSGNNKERGIIRLWDADYPTMLTKKFLNRKPYVPQNEKIILSFMPGTVQKIMVTEGQSVKRGDALLILESMKMMNRVRAQSDGVIKKINIKEGESIPKNHPMIELE